MPSQRGRVSHPALKISVQYNCPISKTFVLELQPLVPVNEPIRHVLPHQCTPSGIPVGILLLSSLSIGDVLPHQCNPSGIPVGILLLSSLSIGDLVGAQAVADLAADVLDVTLVKVEVHPQS